MSSQVKNQNGRRTQSKIPLVIPQTPSIDIDSSHSALSNSQDSVVFSDDLKSEPNINIGIKDLASSNGAKALAQRVNRPHAVDEILKSRKNAQVHIFAAALLEHLCHMVVPDPDLQKRVFEEVRYQLSDRQMVSPYAFLDNFSLLRKKYQVGFTELIKATVTMVEKDPSYKALTAYPSMSRQSQLSLLMQGGINRLIRSPSDPRSDFYSSRYSTDFHEIKCIGKGGFGSVYKVHNTIDDAQYAVKKVKLKCLSHEKCTKLLREVKVLANLNHPSVVRYNSAWFERDTNVSIQEVEDADNMEPSASSQHSVHDAGSDDVFENQRIVLHIQMELCHSNLHDWLVKRNKSLVDSYPSQNIFDHVNELENMHFTRQLLSGLDYIHTHGIIHRDIKTRNIFIGNYAALKIGDFGLARDIVATSSPVSSSDSFSFLNSDQGLNDKLSKGIGTSIYSSPEQQTQSRYNYKTDVYSAGIIIFELYCLFTTEMERYRMIKDLKANRTIPQPLMERWYLQMKMVMSLLHPNPTERPSAKDLLASELYIDKDQIILHLESRIEELENRNKQLVKEQSVLKEIINIEANDYALFLKWKEKQVGGKLMEME